MLMNEKVKAVEFYNKAVGIGKATNSVAGKVSGMSIASTQAV